MPKYALLLITKQDGSEPRSSEIYKDFQRKSSQEGWIAFVEKAETDIPKESYEQLNLTAYLVKLSSGLEALVKFHNLAKEFQVAIKTLFFEEDPTPSWITSYEIKNS